MSSVLQCVTCSDPCPRFTVLIHPRSLVIIHPQSLVIIYPRSTVLVSQSPSILMICYSPSVIFASFWLSHCVLSSSLVDIFINLDPLSSVCYSSSLFTTAPILKHFDPDLPIHLHTDASGFAISGVVSQLHDPHWHPVAFYSRKCTPAKCNYDIHDRELLAVVESMRHWRHYLEGSRNPVHVLSDHENLKIMSTKALNRRQARWAELLDFVLIPIPVPTPPNVLRLLPSNFTGSIVGVHAVEALELTLRERIISSYSTDAVASQHTSDPQHPWSCSKDGLLLHKGLVYIPESSSLRMDILREHHDVPLAGHPGIARTIELITQNYWFPGLNSFTKDYINSCHLCQQEKAPRHPRHSELASLPVLDSPWKGLSCDFITSLSVSNSKELILEFVDRMTKIFHFIPCLISISFLVLRSYLDSIHPILSTLQPYSSYDSFLPSLPSYHPFWRAGNLLSPCSIPDSLAVQSKNHAAEIL